MTNYKQLLATFIEVVTFLLAAFGGFLKNIAPPDQVGASFPVGILSFLTLIVLMIISAIGRNAPARSAYRRWIAAGILFFLIAVPSAIVYRHMLGTYTYPQHSDMSKRQISAPDAYLTPEARQYKGTNGDITPEDLVRNLPEGDVWTQAGIERVESQLLATYGCLVLSIAAAIFSLLEANMRGRGAAPTVGVNSAKDSI